MLSVEKIKNTLQSFFTSQPIERAWIFGSYARGEQTPDSDIDILVDFNKDNYPSLLNHVRMIYELEKILGIKIDLVPNDGLYPSIRPIIEKERILLYEKH
ncbi:MAG: nucleotidyltransferase family protein [Muribaculaceae bacterium]|nr:nucleotidyltransferase family protein [Muribaculaceae bacterium]